MSTTLTQAQIDCFGMFRNHVEETLRKNTKGIKGSTNRVVTTQKSQELFLNLLTSVSRPSKLNRVLNSQTALKDRGFTKSNIQKSRNETRWGKQQRVLLTRPDGTPDYLFTPRCAVMYTSEAYRNLRAEETGDNTPEPIYVLLWKHVPQAMQDRMAEQFPRSTDANGKPYPTFVPQGIGVVVKRGRVVDGTRREWARIQFLVLAKYGDQDVVIPDIIVWNKDTCDGKTVIQRLAEVTNCPVNIIPVWAEEVTVEQPLAKAASTQVALKVDFDFAF